MNTQNFHTGLFKLLAFALPVLTGGIVLFSTPSPVEARLKTYVQNNRGGSVPLKFAPTPHVNTDTDIPNRKKFKMHCWVDFKWHDGNYNTNRWFYGQEYNSGHWGWVHSSYVINQERVPAC